MQLVIFTTENYSLQEDINIVPLNNFIVFSVVENNDLTRRIEDRLQVFENGAKENVWMYERRIR